MYYCTMIYYNITGRTADNQVTTSKLLCTHPLSLGCTVFDENNQYCPIYIIHIFWRRYCHDTFVTLSRTLVNHLLLNITKLSGDGRSVKTPNNLIFINFAEKKNVHIVIY